MHLIRILKGEAQSRHGSFFSTKFSINPDYIVAVVDNTGVEANCTIHTADGKVFKILGIPYSQILEELEALE